MPQQTYDIDLINQVLEQADIDLQVSPIPNSAKILWLYGRGAPYKLKVSVKIIVLLYGVLSNNFDPEDNDQLKIFENLLGDSFLQMNIPGFLFFPQMGFIAEKYAEFFIDYEKAGEIIDEQFKVGDIEVEVSYPSSLFCLLQKKFEDKYFFEIEEKPVIKLKGTSYQNIEDDIYGVLYYLNILFPSAYGDLPRIVAWANEDIDYIDIDTSLSITQRDFPKPTSPTALRLFTTQKNNLPMTQSFTTIKF